MLDSMYMYLSMENVPAKSSTNSYLAILGSNVNMYELFQHSSTGLDAYLEKIIIHTPI